MINPFTIFGVILNSLDLKIKILGSTFDPIIFCCLGLLLMIIPESLYLRDHPLIPRIIEVLVFHIQGDKIE